jgi:DNA invertase Pin-like site-specific DNA recombinase
VSTRDQSLAAQLTELKKAGCCRIYSEKCSSVGARPGWQALFEQLRAGDTVAVVRLDRIGRQIGEVIRCCQEVTEAGGFVRALAQGIDTRSPTGRMQLPIFAAFAETERTILIERTRAGLEAARAAGRVFGRPRKRTPQKDALIRHLKKQGFSDRQIAAEVQVGASTVRRALADTPGGDPRQLKLIG